MITYRRDIDGLRGVSIIAVVFFHLGITWCSGGYVGVDVFFVISGYLITGILLRNPTGESLSLLQFYERRIRRILPALAAVLIAVTIASIFILLPDELVKYALNLIEAAGFVLNIFLWRDMGYFAPSAIQRPLLHLWSLSVEEQFYLLWPLVLLFLQKLNKPRLMYSVVSAIVILSMAASQWLAINAHGAAFYLTPSRAWEPMLGAWLAFPLLPKSSNKIALNVLAIAGFALILFSISQFSDATIFPGLNAAIPCVGAALIIYAGDDNVTLVGRLLSMRPLVFVGLISYSLYLWHWPIYVFTRLVLNHPLSLIDILAVIFVSTLLAVLTWRFVETPFRQKRRSHKGRKAAFVLAGAVFSVLCVTGWMLAANNGFPQRLPADVLTALNRAEDKPLLTANCHAAQGYAFPPTEGCLFGAAAPHSEYNAILWGDSHANALEPAIASLARASGLTFRQITKSGCSVANGPTFLAEESPDTANGCAAFNVRVMRLIGNKPDLKLVVLTAYWVTYGITSPRPAFARSMAMLVDRITARGVRVLLIGETPDLPFAPARCIARAILLNKATDFCQKVPAAQSIGRSAIINDVLTQVAKANPLANIFLPARVMCDSRMCRTTESNNSLYLDDNHLSITGADYLSSPLVLQMARFARGGT